MKNKHVVPVGSFASYDDKGNVTLKNEPLVENPYFRPGNDRYKVLKDGKPGVALWFEDTPKKNKDGVYEINIHKGQTGLMLDADIKGGPYRVSASPDGKNWFVMYDAVNRAGFRTAVDLSVFAGNRDLYLKTFRFYGDGKPYKAKGTRVENRHRFVSPDGEMVWRIPVKGLTDAFAEVFAGNNSVIELSADCSRWTEAEDWDHYGQDA